METVRSIRGIALAHVKRLGRRALSLCIALQIAGCHQGSRAVELPPPTESTTIGPGDVFEIRIVGEDKLPSVFTVAPDGSADIPYIKRIKVGGLEPHELAELVRTKLIEGQILTDPSVSVSVKEYNTKRIEVLGEVQKPGSLSMLPGMTLLRAISLVGGFTNIANKNKVTIRRRLAGGSIKAATVSVDDIMENRLPDLPLQAGDSVNVEQRVF